MFTFESIYANKPQEWDGNFTNMLMKIFGLPGESNTLWPLEKKAGKTKSMTFQEMFNHSGLYVPETLRDCCQEGIYISGI